VQAFADPAPAWTPTMFGLTAVLLGGLGLHGGEGSLIGVILGALTLSTLQALFVTLHTELWVPVVAQGLVLVAIAVATSPVLARRRIQAGAERSRSASRPAKVG
jgi:ribose transport system permease protein